MKIVLSLILSVAFIGCGDKDKSGVPGDGLPEVSAQEKARLTSIRGEMEAWSSGINSLSEKRSSGSRTLSEDAEALTAERTSIIVNPRWAEEDLSLIHI